MADILTAQFVDGPSTTATLRYDFFVNAPSCHAHLLNEGGLSLGSPAWSGEPQGVGGRYDYRRIQFIQRVEGTKVVALARLSALAKELQRDTNWLKIQFAGSLTAFYYKTYKTDPGELRLDYVETSQAWDITVTLVAESLAYGARVTIPTAQVIQAPADLAGPTRTAMRVVLPTIKGDAPTPLRVSVTPAASPANNLGSVAPSVASWLVGCLSGSATMADPVFDGNSVFTGISGFGGNTADATYFGGGYNTVTVGAATPNLLTRFSVLLPNTVPQGRYKTLLRCRFTAGAATSLLFRMRTGPNGIIGASTPNPAVTIDTAATDTGRNFWVDLGEISVPFGINPPSDGGGTQVQGVFWVDIGTASGAASSVNVDAVKLIPVDGPNVTQTTLLRAVGPANGASVPHNAVFGTFDGGLESYWPRVTSSGVYFEGSPALRGYFPVADPAAAQNVLIVMALDSGPGSASATSYITALNAQSAVDVSYYPRYLHVGDGT